MTISASSTLEYSRDQLGTMALQLCGLLEAGRTAKPADLAMAAGFMNLELQSLPDNGPIRRSVSVTTQALNTDTATYSLPSTALDIQLGPNDLAGVVYGDTGAETPVTNMSHGEYLAISTKDTSGRPTKVYIQEGAVLSLTFWPIPSEDMTFRYSEVRLLADADAGDVTLELARKWLKAIAYLTAGHLALAKSLPLDKASYLTNRGESMKQTLKDADKPKGKIRFAIGHSARRW